MEAEKAGEFIAAKRVLTEAADQYVPEDLNPENLPAAERFERLWERGLALFGSKASEYGGSADIHGHTKNGIHARIALYFSNSNVYQDRNHTRKIEAYWFDASTGEQLFPHAELVNDWVAEYSPEYKDTLVGLTRLEETMAAAEQFLTENSVEAQRMTTLKPVTLE